MEPYIENPDAMRNDIYAGAEQRDGKVARVIEKQASKIPSDVFLWAAGAAVLGSLAFQVLGTRRNVKLGSIDKIIKPRRASAATFVGMWVPSLLILGLYSRLVKALDADKVAAVAFIDNG